MNSQDSHQTCVPAFEVETSSADLGSEIRRDYSFLRLMVVKNTGIVGSDCFDGLNEEDGVG